MLHGQGDLLCRGVSTWGLATAGSNGIGCWEGTAVNLRGQMTTFEKQLLGNEPFGEKVAVQSLSQARAPNCGDREKCPPAQSKPIAGAVLETS